MKWLLILALAACPSLAAAQDLAGEEGNEPAARLALEAYGKCVAEKRTGEAHRLLMRDFSSVGHSNSLRILSDDSRICTRDILKPGRNMAMDELLFSGAIAESMLEADATPLNIRLARNAERQTATYSPTDTIAQCIARSVPDQVSALLNTSPGSEDEVSVGATILQIVPACSRAAGVSQQVELSLVAARAMIATAAYRLVTLTENTDAQG